jgi:hypothetical protein
MYSNGIETVTGVRNGHLWPTNSVTVALDIPLRVVFQVPDCCLNGSDALWDIAMPSGDVLPTNGNTWSVGARHDNDKHLVERENRQETDNRLLPSLSDDVDIEHRLKSVASRFTSKPNAAGFHRTTCNECAGNSVLDEIDKITVTSHEFDNDSEDCCNDQWDVDCRDVVPDDCDKAGDSRDDEVECDCGRDGRKSHNNYSNDVYAMSSSDELLTESQQNACSANCLSGQLSDVDSAIYRSPCSNFWQTAYIDLTSNDADCVDDGVDMAMSSSCDEVFDFEDCDNDSCCLEPPGGGSAMDSVRALAVRLGLQVMTSPNHVTLDGNGRRDGEGVVEEGIESTADGATKGKQSATVEKLVKIVDDLVRVLMLGYLELSCRLYNTFY